MQCYNFLDPDFSLGTTPFAAESVLPTDSILLEQTPFTYGHRSWETFWLACRELAQSVQPTWVFVNACWDPFRLDNDSIQQRRQQLAEIWPGSKICILSARAQHFYDDLLGCLYFPLFLFIKYPELYVRKRSGRIGCLNRNNAAHRVWLMHHLLDQKLIDPDRDVYSVSFTNIFTDTYNDIGVDWFNTAQRRWPAQLSTHPDGFPNDYSIDHPAWHTGIAVITETEPGADTIICEKTGKGILSQSCFSIYMADVGYRVLEDLGFEPRFFPDHAEDFNIEPILNICRTIITESQALEYRQQHMDKIQHNFDWFGFRTGTFQSRPWWDRYEPKLRLALDSL